VVTDVMRGGKPVIGYAFSSTGRPAPELQIRNRFVPRLMAAKPHVLLDRTGFDPERATEVMNTPEKPGGDAETFDRHRHRGDCPMGRRRQDRGRAGLQVDRRPLPQRRLRREGVLLCGLWLVRAGKTVQDLKDE